MDLARPLDTQRAYEGKERPVSWLPASTLGGRVAADRWLYPVTNTCAYAYSVLRTSRSTDARIWTGADGNFSRVPDLADLRFTPGAAYEDCDNGNRSAVHWDLVRLLSDGEIWFDGVLIQKNGRFVHRNLLELNPA